MSGENSQLLMTQPGDTRDRIYFNVEWQNKSFTVIGTGGIVPEDEDNIVISY